MECKAWYSSGIPPVAYMSKLALELEKDPSQGSEFELDHSQDSVQLKKSYTLCLSTNFLNFVISVGQSAWKS